MNKKTVPALALLLSVVLAGCAADSDAIEEGAGSSEDEIKSLSTSEVVGSLKASWYAGEAAAPSGRDAASYRAFKFDAYKGQKLTAYVVASNQADPIAYILDASFRRLKQNDDRAVATGRVKDAAIEFTPPADGTYYLAFRTKDRQAATVMARIIEDEVAGPKTKTFADGWPVRQRRSGEDQYTYEQGKRAVEVSAYVKEGATSITNYSGCPAEPFRPGAGLSVSSSATFTVDPVARRITLGGGVVNGTAFIGDDGVFSINSGAADRWGFKRAKGRVSAGGFVIVESAEWMDCSSNYAGDRVHNATKVGAAVGAAAPNYR